MLFKLLTVVLLAEVTYASWVRPMTAGGFGGYGPYGPYGPGGYRPWGMRTTSTAPPVVYMTTAQNGYDNYGYTTNIFAGIPSSLAAFALSAIPPTPDPRAGKCGGSYKISNKGATFIKSPNFPNHYPRLGNCVYKFSAGDGKRVKITFTSMNVEQATSCVFDSVKIINGGPNGQQVAKICGNTNRGFTLKGKTGTIIFKTDGSVQKNGWRAKLTAV